MYSIDHFQTCFCFVRWNAKYILAFDSFHNTSSASCTSQTRRLCSLTDNRIINQWIDRMTHIFVLHIVVDTVTHAPRACECCFNFVEAFNRNDNASAVKISPCGFVALHSDRYSYCFEHIPNSKPILTKLCSIESIVYSEWKRRHYAKDTKIDTFILYSWMTW